MTKKIIFNPYENIDWSSVQKHKANLHCHTTQSDGSLHPHEAIDMYCNAGYSILAITDHDREFPHGYSNSQEILTYPWDELNNKFPDWENRDSDALGMEAVNGVEVSATPHLLSHFNNFPGNGTSSTLWALQQIKDNGGLATFAHPGRYWVDKNYGNYHNKNWYLDWYRDFRFRNTLHGVEVYNSMDNHPEDETILWDYLLTETMPTRPVFAFGNDDAHSYTLSGDFGASWNLFLLESLSAENIKKAYSEGGFFACGYTHPSAPEQPEVQSIVVTDTEITLLATGYDSIEWISEGQVVGTEPTINIGGLNKYVRAKLIVNNEYGETRLLTQPFGLSEQGLKFETLIFDRNSIDVFCPGAATIEFTQRIAGKYFGSERVSKTTHNTNQITLSVNPNCISASIKALGVGEVDTGEVFYMNPLEVREHQRKQRTLGAILIG